MKLSDMGFSSEREEFIYDVCVCFNALSLVEVDHEFEEFHRLRQLNKRT